jgi:hypothetical protein
MAEEFDLETLNRILTNEIFQRIGINVVDISYAYQQEEDQVLVEQQSEDNNKEHNSFEELLEKENKAWEIAREQEDKIEDFKYKGRQYDADQARHRSNSYRSEHETDSLYKCREGDLPIDRFWYYSTKYSIDGTVTTPLYLTASERANYSGSSWYKKKSKSKYRAVTIQLSRHIKEREYGRVFFSTETRYVPLGTPIPPVRREQPVIGYIKYGDNKIYCKATHYRNPLKGVLYKNKGRSILKELTQLGETINTIFWNLEIYRNDRERHSERNEGSIARSLFKSLKTDFNYHIEDWAYTYSQTKLDQDDLEWAQAVRKTKYDLSRKFLADKIKEIQIYSEECKRSSTIIQREWKRIYCRRNRKAIIIQRAYRNYVTHQVADGKFAFIWMNT